MHTPGFDPMHGAAVLPFYIQYEVRPSPANTSVSYNCAIATVIVFAENDELARARAARHIAREEFEITEVKRAMLISRHQVTRMDGVLKTIYQKAEQVGVAATIDGW